MGNGRKMETTNYPRRWKNKTSGQVVRVMPWWEAIQDGKIEQVNELGEMLSEVGGRPAKFGTIVQIGYLIENEHGIWFGLGPQAKDQFEDLGEIKEGNWLREEKENGEA